MNLGLSELQKSEFISYIPVIRSIVNYPNISNNYRVSGLSSAEYCFLVIISKSNENKTNQFVLLKFKISQHHRDIKLLELIAKYLDCG